MTFRARLASLTAAVMIAGGAVMASAPSADAATCYQSMWRINSRGTCVKYIQQLVNYFGPTKPALVVDGAFGPKTDAAVRALQRIFVLRVDGIVGPQTWNVICYPQAGPGPIPGFPYSAAKAAGCPLS